jgi:hypothetical protein
LGVAPSRLSFNSKFPLLCRAPARARQVDLGPFFEFDANAANPANIDMRFAYVAWMDFLDYLAQQRGKETFDGFFRSVQQDPAKIQELFSEAMVTACRGWWLSFKRRYARVHIALVEKTL